MTSTPHPYSLQVYWYGERGIINAVVAHLWERYSSRGRQIATKGGLLGR